MDPNILDDEGMNSKGIEMLENQVLLGHEAEQFMRTRLGQHLQARAVAARQEALEALGMADPEDAKSIRDLQMAFNIASCVIQWITDCITQGEISLQQLRFEQVRPNG